MLSLAELYKHKPRVKLAESLVPARRLELIVDMETHILRFVVTKWDAAGKQVSQKHYDVLHFAVDDYDGGL